MRETKFRGKRIDNRKWVYGYYVQDEEWAKHYIYYSGKVNGEVYWKLMRVEVIAESVGQFTRLYDKNKVEIYEKDILKDIDFGGSIENPILKIMKYIRNGYEPSNSYINWEKGILTYEIVGNTYENPELIKEVYGIHGIVTGRFTKEKHKSNKPRSLK